MSLTQALLSSASGLRATQAGLALISSNVANAETPGYVRKTLVQVTTSAGGFAGGVRTTAVNRELDQYVQRQLRIEAAGGSYADLRAQFYERLQLLFGQPGADGALETTFNNFTAALQALATSPESHPARINALNAAQALTQHLNGMSGDIQALRSEAERGLAQAAQSANEALAQIADINQRLAASPTRDMASAALMDRRDYYIDRLSELMDIRVAPTGEDQIGVFTTSGVQLVGAQAARLQFDAQGSLTAGMLWSADPAQRGVGTLSLVSASGDSIDLLATNSIRSGRIAALAEMRDRTLVEAQTQLDALAAGMAQALSDRTTAGSPLSVGAQDGFEVDLAGLLAGNSVRVSYTEAPGGTQRTVTLVRVDDPAALPLGDDVTADPNDRVVGVNFAGGMGSVATQAAAALGPGFTVSNPSGAMLRVLDDGGASVSLDALSATRTVTALADGGPELPLFLDGALAYSGAIAAHGGQMLGLAGRIALNPLLWADPAKLVAYGAATSAGDATRPSFILAQLGETTLTFPPQTGIGSAAAPFRAPIAGFLRQAIGQQADAAAAAESLRQGQQIVVDALAQRAADASGVNIDQEMAHLLQLQAAYSANARVLSAVKEMMELLSQL